MAFESRFRSDVKADNTTYYQFDDVITGVVGNIWFTIVAQTFGAPFDTHLLEDLARASVTRISAGQ